MPIEYPGGGVVRGAHRRPRAGRPLRRQPPGQGRRSRGPGAAAFVNACLTNDLGRIAPGQAQYTLCCDETGGVVDDLIAYLRSDDDVFLIPNAANTAEVVRRLRAAAPEGIEVTEPARAVRRARRPGPAQRRGAAGARAADRPRLHVVRRGRLAGPPGHRLPHRLHRRARLRARAARGTTRRPCGTRCTEAAAAYDGLPCGLGARDTLRTEMGYPLHGHDLSLDITPVQARAGWAVGLEEGRRSGAGRRWSPRRPPAPRRASWGLLATGRGIPRAHCQVRDAHGEVVGEVTSGTFSPTLKQGIALALLAPRCRRGRRGRRRRARARGRRDRGQAAVRAGPDPPGLTAAARAPGRRGAAGGGSGGVRQDDRGGRQADREGRPRPPPRARRR